MQLVSEQLNLAQRGMLPVVSSAQSEPQIFNPNTSNRHQNRTYHQLDNISDTSDSSNGHRTVLRLMNTSSFGSSYETQTFTEQPGNLSICHLNEMSTNTVNVKHNPIAQIKQAHSSQDFHPTNQLTNTFDDSKSQTITSPVTPAQLQR